MAKRSVQQLLIGVDTGGTFTDIVYLNGRRYGLCKVPSTPNDPARAVLTALARLFPAQAPDCVTYGTTVATNALLERTGARTALITTTGFEDVLEIARQARPRLYALEPSKPVALVPARLRFGANERTLHDGTIHQPLAPGEVERLATLLKRQRVEAVAICLLHSVSNPSHELALARGLAGLGVELSVSHELSPVAGEYERTSTTVVNAYLQPRVAGHLARLARETGSRTFRVMQSNGGAIGVTTACREPIRTMLSGPAGGVIAARECATRAGLKRVITFDMGGTSTDVALVDGGAPWRGQSEIDGMPVRTPCIDIHTVGAGGGSIARMDAGGALKVGPESAGADPGPACYGSGSDATVTDANVVLGRLRPETFLSGAMTLDPERAHRAVARLAREMGRSVEKAAEGIVRVVEGNMERAVRVITVERGQDPRSCVLVAFGGAAGLHACGLAATLGIGRILVPSAPGVFSARGVLCGSVVLERTVALRSENPSYASLQTVAARLEAQARAGLAQENLPSSRCRTAVTLRVRYRGQSLELDIPLTRSFRRAFDREHARLFRSSDSRRSIEVCGVRVTATGPGQPLPAQAEHARADRPSVVRRERVYVAGGFRRVPVLERSAVRSDRGVVGPAIITEYSSTFLVAAGWRAQTDARANLQVRYGRA